MSNQSIESVSENWYSRLNNLKYRYTKNDLSDEKREQLKKLITVMINRMMKIAPYYIEMRQKRVLKSRTVFKPGGITFK